MEYKVKWIENMSVLSSEDLEPKKEDQRRAVELIVEYESSL